jgi:hypothetical protein
MSRKAEELDQLVRRKRAELGVDREARRDSHAETPDVEAHVPAWIGLLDRLDPIAQDAWDERIRRINEGTATPEDRRIQEAARHALETGAPVPREARRMPGPELAPHERTWTPESLDDPARAVAMGIPPLIAERIAIGDYKATRSTRACDQVGRGHFILVLIGEVGCGKSFAAARWLWRSPPMVPLSLRKRVGPRRFIEAPGLKDIPFEDRPKLGEATALVLDDVGTEQDFMPDDLARIIAARYKNALPTVVTTNLSEVDFAKRYGVRVADRMREVGRFVVASNSRNDSLRGK